MSDKENATQTIDIPVFSKEIQNKPLLGTKLGWLILALSVLAASGLIFLVILNLRMPDRKAKIVVSASPTPVPTVVESKKPVEISVSELRESWLSIERNLSEIDFRQSGLVPPVIDLDIGLDPEML
ncbi:MAG: hypothetical protein ABH867_00300 [Patescibacteria group bacterium]|nr:hypothetical protein [Patescibacteria group bacterium]